MNTTYRIPDTDRPGVGAPLPRGRRLAASVESDIVVSFEPGLNLLPASQSSALGRWANHWMRREPESLIVMACAGLKDRSARVARLRMLRGLLARLGVAQERIRYTGDLIEATGVDANMDPVSPPGVTARLKLVDAGRVERQVRTLRSMFSIGFGTKEVPCTSAS